LKKETPNNNHYRFYPKTIEDAETYFRGFLIDWRQACPGLEKMGLVVPVHGSYTLTAEGLQAANLIWLKSTSCQLPWSCAKASRP
jgi:hypothetical protein